MKRYQECEACGGEGTAYTSRYGGNDPWVWAAGPCHECNGTGRVELEEIDSDVD